MTVQTCKTSPYLHGFLAGLKPDTRLTVSEWADQKRILPVKAAKEAGHWRTSRTPYLKEIMDALSPSSPIEKVVFMKGAQVGGTECGNNWLGYVIDHVPAPMMYVLPTLDLAKRTSKQRIAPMIEEMPVLRDKVKDPRSRDSGNTLLSKEFPGGVLIFTGANSGAGLRSMPARFECRQCGHKHYEKDKPRLLTEGKWVAGTGEKSNKVAGFHLSSLYSPNGWYSWQNAVEDFLAAQKKPLQMKDWTNTVLGETWQDKGETVEHELLYQRREYYPAEVPWWVEVITIGCDVQDDRIEFEVTGWGAGEESWGIDYVRLYGDLSKPGIWTALGDMLRKTYTRQDGITLNAAQVCIDSGGHFTDEVYTFCRRQGANWAIPVKGSSIAGKPIATFPKTRNKKGVYLTLVGSDTAKELLYQRFRILEPGNGYCHWSVSDCFDEDYFRQITAEEKIRKYKNGVPYFQWDAKGRRNEALDCRVYSLTAIRILQQHKGIDLNRLASLREPPEDNQVINPEDAIVQKPVVQRPARRTIKSTYLNG
ncbi:phage terminase large subunit family protein [Endozoicomonas gorgoniicola]|uniref:Phage terminase large subunit family protein n=1 Tax=Endozoicomonas gorgoniicola TaxID=1234144 RepID=A0ABT3MWC2_9GAMM|nr:phage terminase large subunit family protein [Endozoicomonas gorgoniicola]MCW7553304.1 phage terminase large subunit family protein [Endozoicomonas gorgoniicola]